MGRSLNLFSDALVAIDGSKFKAVNGRDRNFTKHKLKARTQQLEESLARYLADLDRADRDPSIPYWAERLKGLVGPIHDTKLPTVVHPVMTVEPVVNVSVSLP